MRSTCAFLLCLCWLLLSSSSAQPHVDTALRYIGTIEHGVNRGRLVDSWNRAVRAPMGSPYCASFVSYCLTASRARTPTVRTAWSRGFITAQSIPASKVLTGEYQIQKGDILIWRRTATQGHIGFAIVRWIRVRGRSAEANTSPENVSGSQWNGGGVYARYRAVSLYNHFRITHITKVAY